MKLNFLSLNPKDVEIVLNKQIRQSFLSETDRILEVAKNPISIELDPLTKEKLKKREILIKLGFVNSKDVIDIEKESKKAFFFEEQNKMKAVLVEAIAYFKEKYPDYKFITETSVITLCAKYGLTFDIIQNYTGEIPIKILNQLQTMNVDRSDDCYEIHGALGRYYMNIDAVEKRYPSQEYTQLCPLSIIAERKKFKNTKANDPEIKDYEPIVLKPVFFANEKHYLIVAI